eukprot:865075_1
MMDSVMCVRHPGKHLVIMFVEFQAASINLRLFKNRVLDYGARYLSIPKRSTNCSIQTFNVLLEYENIEVNSGLCYSSDDVRRMCRKRAEYHRCEEQSVIWKQEIAHFLQPKGHRRAVA